jgi:hypothetical protein
MISAKMMIRMMARGFTSSEPPPDPCQGSAAEIAESLTP